MLHGDGAARRRRPDQLPELVLGAGDGRGFGGFVSPAKLALAEDLDPAVDGFELRIHGVGGSSAEQLLEQSQTVQVGGDGIAQFVRRWGSRRRAVPWPVEGYWWGGLTSRPTTRAFWVLLLPLLLCNLASWMLPAPGGMRGRRGHRLAGAGLPVVMRWAGYALTLLLTACLATASMDTFGWQCARLPARRAGGHGPVGCLPGWLHWTPAAPGPRLVVFALVPVLVLAVIGYACQRTLRGYERWQLPAGLPADPPAAQAWWPLTAEGFWHGLRPVRRQQMLHLAGAAALISLYLAIPPSPSHPAARVAAMVAAGVLLALPAATLALPKTGRPAINPHRRKPPDLDPTSFDWWCGVLLILSLAALVTLLLARIWWQPATAGSRPGVLPWEPVIWWGLTLAMGGLIGAAAALTVIARNRPEMRLDRPFAAGLLAPLTLGLACVSGGIFAAGLNLLLPNLLISSQFHGTGPAIPGLPSAKYPLVLPVPVYGFMAGLLAMAAAAVMLAIITVVWFLLQAWRRSCVEYLQNFYALDGPHFRKVWRQRWRIALSWTKARLADHLGIAVTALSLAGITGVAAFDALATQPSATSWLTTLAHTGQWIALAAALALFGLTRQAFTSSGTRRQIGVLWDVGTFWPRASQPLAPPCYMERSVPETVNRLRRALGDTRRDTPPGHTDPAADRAENAYIEDDLTRQLGPQAARRIVLDQDWVLINGYSQGSPIAAAVIAQLPEALRDKITLVTVGCPLRRLYGRAFPAYFGQRCLLELASTLAPPQYREPVEDVDRARRRVLPATRWRNLIRPSDYVGSYVFCDQLLVLPEPRCDVDRRLLDPPRIIPAHGTTPPPIHEHSDYWPDPQTALHTQELLTRNHLWTPHHDLWIADHVRPPQRWRERRL